MKIKFGTDGWRAIIAKEYTTDGVQRVSEAAARWMIEKKMSKIVIGHDCRFGGEMFLQTAAQVFAHFGIQTIVAKDFVSTPMVSLGVVKTKADLGVVITASHNPASYNGYKLKSSFGGPTIPKEIEEIESIIPDTSIGKLAPFDEFVDEGKIEFIDLEQIYFDHVEANFDLKMIKKSGLKMAYDAMYGAGQNVMKRLFPDAALLHCDYNPSFFGQAPEPIHRNLQELSQYIKDHDEINLGIANDGDADRIGMYDEKGNFVDSHHILLLLLYYMKEYKKLDGKVVITFSVTDKMKRLAELYNLDLIVTKVGFKYIAEIMIEEDVLVGGEESGGLAIKGHIPERDGIWIGLTIMEFMAKTGKSINDLIQDIYDKVGEFKYDRDDLHLTDVKKHAIINRCKAGEIKSIGGLDVRSTETVDGYKFNLPGGRWVMVRPSGTEPVLRVYAQDENWTAVRKLLDHAHIALQEGIN